VEQKTPRTSPAAWIAWAVCGLIYVFVLVNLLVQLLHLPADTTWLGNASQLVFILTPTSYALVAALLASRQPRNTIAWLLMLIAIAIVLIGPVDNYIDSFTGIPSPTPLLLIAVWFQNWSWLLFIVPLLMVFLLFPTGQPPSPRLRWVPYFAAVLVLCFALLNALQKTLSPTSLPDWQLPNPIGFAPDSAAWLVYPIFAGLVLLVLLCPASLFYRYRRAAPVEREQIKWILYISSVFVILYLPWIGWMDRVAPVLSDFLELLTFLTIYIFPVSIAMAVLRYRLWDIDLLIRRSLIYGALTVTLGVVFFVVIALLTQVFGILSGAENSPVVIVLSTLVIAAIFTPLRRRIQHDIDRRFFRSKYDTEQTLAQFALNVRNEVELAQLSDHLLEVAQETMHPDKAVLWLRKTRS
jgi:hypothetical protein